MRTLEFARLLLESSLTISRKADDPECSTPARCHTSRSARKSARSRSESRPSRPRSLLKPRSPPRPVLKSRKCRAEPETRSFELESQMIARARVRVKPVVRARRNAGEARVEQQSCEGPAFAATLGAPQKLGEDGANSARIGRRDATSFMTTERSDCGVEMPHASASDAS